MALAYSERSEREARAYLQRLERASWVKTCRRDLTAFAIEALAPMGQTPARHHRLLLNHLEKVARGEIDRLMVFMPPGHAKSVYCSMLFPAWMFAQRPGIDILGTSHGSELAEDFSRRVQTYILQNEEVLGYSLESQNVQRWRTTNGGFYRAVGIGGSLTGRRGDIAIIDDPVKDAIEAESMVSRANTWEWYQSVLYTRMKPGSAIVLIQTRWHPDDLGGRLLEAQKTGGDQWTVINLPALADSLNDPLGRAPGEALWPEWQDREALERIRANVGEHVWGSLYQQDPRPRGAAFFDIDSLLINGEPVPTPDKTDIVFAVIDTAIKAGSQHNSTAVTWYSYNTLTKPSTLILDWDIVQIEGADQEAWLPSVFTRCEELARQTGARRGSVGAMIEDKATGTVLLQQAKNRGQAAFPIESKLTSMGKEERAIAAAPYIIAGDVKITREAYDKVKVHKGRSANHLLEQIVNFRLGSKATDGLDLLDTFCYGVLVTRGTGSGERKGI